MAGNVNEWVQDWDLSAKPAFLDLKSINTNPYQSLSTPELREQKMARGGSYFTDPISIRASNTGGTLPDNNWVDFGFRCVRTQLGR